MTDYRHPFTVEVVRWMDSGLWVCRGVVCGMLCETMTPRATREEAWADAYDWCVKLNSKGAKVKRL